MRSIDFGDAYSDTSNGSWNAFLAGACLGAAGMYLIDPNGGARRRGVIRDKLTHAAHKVADGVDTTRRDLTHRAQGVWTQSRSSYAPGPVSDHILIERVRAKLGRYVSHPHALDVEAQNGCVTLRGTILAREARPLLRAVERIPGVQSVDNQLEQHIRAAGIPSLQGGRVPAGDSLDALQDNWAPATRTLVGSVGTAIVAYSAARRDVFGTLFGLMGMTLVLRAATNVDPGRLVGLAGGRRAVDLQKTIHIDAPVEIVFEFWKHFENFPRFMTHVREVRPTSIEGQSHWTVAGPGGVPFEFDAVITRMIPHEVVAWKSVEGAAVAHAGIVRFEPDGGGTRVHIRFSYNPPAGAVGHAVAALLGKDAKSLMDDDLARAKTVIETGNPPRDAAQPPPKGPEALM